MSTLTKLDTKYYVLYVLLDMVVSKYKSCLLPRSVVHSSCVWLSYNPTRSNLGKPMGNLNLYSPWSNHELTPTKNKPYLKQAPEPPVTPSSMVKKPGGMSLMLGTTAPPQPGRGHKSPTMAASEASPPSRVQAEHVHQNRYCW